MSYARLAEKGGFVVPTNEGRARYVTVAEVAEQLRVSNMTVYRLVQSGALPALRVGRARLVLPDRLA